MQVGGSIGNHVVVPGDPMTWLPRLARRQPPRQREAEKERQKQDKITRMLHLED